MIALMADHYDLHYWPIDQWSTLVDHYESILSADEIERWRGMVLPSKAQRWRASRVGLRKTLAGLLSCTPAAISFATSDLGKPCIAYPQTELQFSFSHSANMAILATTKSGPIGIDVEEVREVRRLEDKARLFLNAQELDELLACPKEDRSIEFLKRWVQKESLAKALGGGLADVFGMLEIHADWQIEMLPIEGHVAAVAFRKPE